MAKKLKAMKKLFDQCKRNPKTPDVILPPISSEPCKWWRKNVKDN